jgi:WD40 repeat protein
LKIWGRPYSTERGPLATIRGHAGEINALACSPNGRQVVSASRDGTLKIWTCDLLGARVATLEGHKREVTACAYSPRARKVLTASKDRTLRIWDEDNKTRPVILKGHAGEVNVSCYSADGREVVSGSSDGVLRIWDAKTGRPTHAFVTRAAVTALAVAGDHIVVGDGSGVLYVLQRMSRRAESQGG